MDGCPTIFSSAVEPQEESELATITRPAALVRQGMLRLYATSLQVRDLKRQNFYTINKLDPAVEASGYQRLLNESRVKRLSEYLIEGHEEKDAFLPTSIFLATSKNIPLNCHSTLVLSRSA